jgi:hypothetical protein
MDINMVDLSKFDLYGRKKVLPMFDEEHKQRFVVSIKDYFKEL